MAALDTTRTHFGSFNMGSRITSTITSMFGAVSTWNDARMTNNELSRLSNHELEDIGLARGDIDAIARGDFIR